MKNIILILAILLSLSTAAHASPCNIKLCNGSSLLMATGDKVLMELSTCGTTSSPPHNIYMILRILGVI